ncbi:MAG: energy-coupling factor transporter transmembrane protein EcfT [Oscillospiraceae bacterium]|nr:energy-coupling factor transporter transmembrane protein EcfT [Oscillospiraceae bacterium]
MNNPYDFKVEKNSALPLDPRTKILLTLTISSVLIAGGHGGIMNIARLCLASIPFVCFLWDRRFCAALIYPATYIILFVGEIALLPHMHGILGNLCLSVVAIFSHMLPGFIMGYFLISSTTVSEFVASMERMHIPQQIIIPVSVMFRFFPTVGEETAAINDAMRMRGIMFGNPMKMLEYRLVPMLMCSVKIGEELSAAALTRGLGSPVKRTNICEIGFGIPDIFAVLICALGFAAFLLTRMTI